MSVPSRFTWPPTGLRSESKRKSKVCKRNYCRVFQDWCSNDPDAHEVAIFRLVTSAATIFRTCANAACLLADGAETWLLPLLQIKRYPRPRPSLSIPNFHFLQLVFALNFLKFSRIKSFHNFTTRIIGIGMNDPMRWFKFEPRDDLRIPRARFGMRTFQHITEVAAAHLFPKQPLLGPMEELQTQISD